MFHFPRFQPSAPGETTRADSVISTTETAPENKPEPVFPVFDSLPPLPPADEEETEEVIRDAEQRSLNRRPLNRRTRKDPKVREKRRQRRQDVAGAAAAAGPAGGPPVLLEQSNNFETLSMLLDRVALDTPALHHRRRPEVLKRTTPRAQRKALAVSDDGENIWLSKDELKEWNPTWDSLKPVLEAARLSRQARVRSK